MARRKLDGMKEIAYEVSIACGKRFTRSAASKAAHPARRNRLPVFYTFSGGAWAYRDEIRRWARYGIERRWASPRLHTRLARV